MVDTGACVFESLLEAESIELHMLRLDVLPSLFAHMHTVVLEDCVWEGHDVSMLANVHTLDISGTSVHDVSALGGLHTLIALDSEIYDVSALGGLHTLDLSATNVVDVSALGKVHTLKLCLLRLDDIGMLGGVLDLSLVDSTIPSDVSALRTVYTLRLLPRVPYCNVSTLSTVHNLTTFRRFVRDDRALAGVEELHLM